MTDKLEDKLEGEKTLEKTPNKTSNKISIGIVGTRSFNDYPFFKAKVTELIPKDKEITIISGGAKGADTFAERYAKENSLNVKVFRPNWSLYGKSAGPIRNKDIILSSDIIIAFWDGKSPGTKSSINLALKHKRELHIVTY